VTEVVQVIDELLDKLLDEQNWHYSPPRQPTPGQPTLPTPGQPTPPARVPATPPAAPPARAPARPTGQSTDPWDALSPNTQRMAQTIAAAARDRQTIRIRYRPKVTTGNAVYRTLQPYSLRWRNIHVNGYDQPPVMTPVFFGYDEFAQTVKMFVLDRIITIERKPKRYAPKWPVEFSSIEIERIVSNLIEGRLP